MKPILQALELGKNLFRFAPLTCAATLTLMLLRSLTSGMGLLLIMPLLHIIGIPILGEGGTVLTRKLTEFFNVLHLPLNLHSVLILFVIVQVVVASLNFLEEMLRSKLQERHQYFLRENLYGPLLNTKWTFFIQRKNSDILHGITSQISSASTAYLLLLQLSNQLILLIAYFSLSLLLSWEMTLVASFVALGLLSIMLPLHRLTAQSGLFFLRHSQSLFQSFYEQLGALKIIKSCNAESRFLKKILSESQSLKTVTHRLTIVRAVSKWLYAGGSAISFCLLLYFAIEKLQLPIDTLLMLLVVFARILPMVSTLQQSYQQLLRHLPSCLGIKALLNECLQNQEIKVVKAQEAVAFEQEITLRNVSYSYYPSVLPMVINDLSLTIPKSKTTAIIGPSGGGKSTIADLIAGLLEPVAGSIYIDKQPLTQKNLIAWRKKISYVTQDAFLFNATIRENLQLLCDTENEQVLWGVLRQASAETFVRKLEKGLDTLIGDRGVRLSGGERQRIALARALLMKPQLLILDESTNALDPDNVHAIQQAMMKLHGETTILIITHQTEMSQFADQIIRMHPQVLHGSHIDNPCVQTP